MGNQKISGHPQGVNPTQKCRGTFYGYPETKAFTLVELIVVITILAILGTIAFVSLQGYSRDARDARRTSDLGNMKKVLSLYITTNSEYPEPSDGEQVTYSGSEVWTQGTFGDSVRAKLGSKANISETPYDPLTYNQYTYSVLNTKREYQIAVVYEGDVAYNPTLKKINNAQAAGAYGTTVIQGDYNGKVAKTRTGSIEYVLAVPSIIKGDTTETKLVDIINLKKLVFNKSKMLPASYSGVVNFIGKQPDGNIVNTGSLVVYSGSNLDTLGTEAGQLVFVQNLAQAYSGTEVQTQATIEPIINNPTLYTAQTIIHNYVKPSVKVTAENTSGGSSSGGGSSGPDLTGKCSISQNPNITVAFDPTYKDDTTYYGTGFYIQSNTCLKWQAHDTTPSDWNGTGHKPKWASGSTDSGDDNYCGIYPEPTWDGNNYTYNPPVGYSADDYEAFKYCESIGDGHWRLPTKREIFSIMTDTKPSGMNYYTALKSISYDNYWSSPTYASYPKTAWEGDFYKDRTKNKAKNNIYNHTICIHD